jgi:SIT family siderophore-iron:H+ symporter-like MFS transporter
MSAPIDKHPEDFSSKETPTTAGYDQHVLDQGVPAPAYYENASPKENILATAGVRRIEAINSQLSQVDRVVVFVGLFLIAYCYGLDGTVRYTYQVSSDVSGQVHELIPCAELRNQLLCVSQHVLP